MSLTVYLSGEIHTDWRDQIIAGAKGLDVCFTAPVTDHGASDDCGVVFTMQMARGISVCLVIKEPKCK